MSTARLAVVAIVAFVVMMVAVLGTVLALQQHQSALATETGERAAAVCMTSVDGRAHFLFFGEALIAATAPEEDPDARRGEVVADFRARLDERFVQQMPAVCEGIMSRTEYRRLVASQAEQIRAEQENS